MCTIQHPLSSFYKILWAFLHGNTSQECHYFLFPFATWFTLINYSLKLRSQRINRIMHCKTFCRILMIVINDSLPGQFTYTHDAISIIHSILFYAINRRIDITSTPVKISCVNVNDQWFSTYLLGMNSCRISQPIMSMYDIKLLLACNHTCHY